MLRRLREASKSEPLPFSGTVEAGETLFGGLEGNKHSREKLRAGRGTVGKIAAVGAKDWEPGQVAARVVDEVNQVTMKGFVMEHTRKGTTISIPTIPRCTAACLSAMRPCGTRSASMSRAGPHQRHRIFLDIAREQLLGHLPQDVAEASRPQHGRQAVEGRRSDRHERLAEPCEAKSMTIKPWNKGE